MKRMMSIAAIALFMAGSSALACDSCGCTAKKAEKKTECTTCSKDKKAETKCGADCKKACCTKTTEAKK
ncbi:hypothetical protein P4E94_00800 [Pontiellaceae bacterium B12219]|nr:hypothetical protein [Pontiellaceae bacterium B12219]